MATNEVDALVIFGYTLPLGPEQPAVAPESVPDKPTTATRQQG